MNPFHGNIELDTQKNDFFREVLYTGNKCQLVVMSLLPNEEIGTEIHDENDQFIRVETGVGKAVIDGMEYDLSDGVAVVIPSGAEHNIINTSSTEKMKLYTIYSPAHHPDKTIHKTKAEADEAEANE
jgi:mannose-6-phosphate isomerase-like protein (cupin superfamily)